MELHSRPLRFPGGTFRDESAIAGNSQLQRGIERMHAERGGRFSSRLGDLMKACQARSTHVDLCLKIHRADYLIVYTPFAKLYWHATHDDKQDASGDAILRQRWANVLERDPYYNPNLSRERADFSLELR